MEAIFTIIGQELEVAKKAVEKEDFNFVNIVGNRILTNLQIADKNEMMFLGWLIRELSSELQILKLKKDNNLNEIKEKCEDYLNELKLEIDRENTEFATYFDKFFDIENYLRKLLLSEKERDYYKEQLEFSKQFSGKMIDIFYANKNTLLIENNTLVLIVANELGRNFNEHGGKEALITYLVLRAFETNYRYIYYEKFFIKNEEAIKRAEFKLKEYVEDIHKLKTIVLSGDISNLYKESNMLLGQLGMDYRLYFLLYYDYSRVPANEGVKEERIELSQETKQKIGDILTASLQEKLG